MFSYTAADVADALRNAKNANAAIKRILKRELRAGDPAERYLKELRATLGHKSPEPLQHLVAKGFEKFNLHLLAVVRNAYLEPLSVITDPVVNKYADDFNKTFERTDGKITVKDEDAFRRMFEEACAQFEQGISQQNLTPAGLMQAVLVTTVFDPDVLKVLEESAP